MKEDDSIQRHLPEIHILLRVDFDARGFRPVLHESHEPRTRTVLAFSLGITALRASRGSLHEKARACIESEKNLGAKDFFLLINSFFFPPEPAWRAKLARQPTARNARFAPQSPATQVQAMPLHGGEHASDDGTCGQG
jgi:hypothetical protein